MKKIYFLFALIPFCFIISCPRKGEQQKPIITSFDYYLINDTDFEITSIYVRQNNDPHWSDNILSHNLAPHDQQAITVFNEQLIGNYLHFKYLDVNNHLYTKWNAFITPFCKIQLYPSDRHPVFSIQNFLADPIDEVSLFHEIEERWINVLFTEHPLGEQDIISITLPETNFNNLYTIKITTIGNHTYSMKTPITDNSLLTFTPFHKHPKVTLINKTGFPLGEINIKQNNVATWTTINPPHKMFVFVDQILTFNIPEISSTDCYDFLFYEKSYSYAFQKNNLSIVADTCLVADLFDLNNNEYTNVLANRNLTEKSLPRLLLINFTNHTDFTIRKIELLGMQYKILLSETEILSGDTVKLPIMSNIYTMNEMSIYYLDSLNYPYTKQNIIFSEGREMVLEKEDRHPILTILNQTGLPLTQYQIQVQEGDKISHHFSKNVANESEISIIIQQISKSNLYDFIFYDSENQPHTREKIRIIRNITLIINR